MKPLSVIRSKRMRSAWICTLVASMAISLSPPVLVSAADENPAVFQDDFGDNNYTGWTTYEGTWNAADGALHTNKGAGYKAVADGTNFSNFTYEADISVKDGLNSDNAGLIFRVSNPTNGADNLKGYYAGIGVNNIVQVGRMNNSWTELASIPYKIEQNKTYHMKVEATGSNIEVYINGEHVVSVVDSMFTSGSVGVRSFWVNSTFDNLSVTDTGPVTLPDYDWSWVKGAVFVPTNAVNQVQQWEEYDHDINDRELSYAHAYGINMVRVFMHNLVWKKDPELMKNNLEDFLQLADKYGIKTELVFFDDCWDDHPHLGPQLPPRYGVHNSRWMEGPGDDIKANYAANKQDLKDYVQGIVNAHLDDPRIAFWNIYNEPSNGESGLMNTVTKQLMNDARMWIKDTGSKIPVSSTAGNFSGGPFSDFITWHPYDASYPLPYGASRQVLADEAMNRLNQSVPGIVEHYGNKGVGYVMWEFGIGRDNTRFPWGTDVNPATSEPAVPFHGIVYPDGHPWDVNDVKAITGDAYDTLPVYRVQYYKDEQFTDLAKTSITPRIDFDLGDEKGTGSPDASAGIAEDHFSVRWAGTVQPSETGAYTIYADSDNIAKVWVGDTLVVDKASNTREEASGSIELIGGKTQPVRVEYVHGTGNSSLHVRWSGPGLPKQAMLPIYSGKSVESIAIKPASVNLKVDESLQLQPEFTPVDAANQEVTWSSSNPGIASVDEHGKVTGNNEGSVTITATSKDGGFTATSQISVAASTMFKNPIVSATAADPSIVFKDGYYYYVKSDKDASILIAKAKRLQDIGSVPRVTVYTPPSGTKYSKEVWAPELQFIDGKWYIYFAADDGTNDHHRMYVLEADSDDPQGTYTLKGKISDATDKWAIDGTVLVKDDNSKYFVWSGWEGDTNVKQNIYIAPMSNPWTISGPRVQISTPDQAWERNGTPYINEGPEVLQKDGKTFIVYSASGSWTDDYNLGMLTNTDGDMLNSASWTKSGPVFSKQPTAYGPGHNTFTKSPDGKEDWIVYHADEVSGGGWGNRSVRAQKFTWNEDGSPNFGIPAAYGSLTEEPSGTPNVARQKLEAENAELGGSAAAVSAANASGGKVAGQLEQAGDDYVQFTVNVPEAGTYTLISMADNASNSGAEAQQDVSVNGGSAQVISYKNYGQNVFAPASMDVQLQAGGNTIRFTKKTNDARIDYIVVDPLENDGTGKPVTSLVLDKSSLTLQNGEKGTLTASLKPLQGTDKRVTYVSSNPDIASVSLASTDTATGSTTLTVEGKQVGTAEIRVVSAVNGSLIASSTVTVRGLPAEPDLSKFTVDSFDSNQLDSAWSIFQESASNWSLTKNPGSLTIHTTATDVYQDNNSQNNVFLRDPGSNDFEIVTKVTAPIGLNHQQAGLFVWQDADNFVKLGHVWANGKIIETAYELNRVYQKPGNYAPHPGGDTMTLKIKKLGNVYTTYYWDGYQWIQASDPVTANLNSIKIGLYANNIVANNDPIDAKFEYFAVRPINGGVDLDQKALTLQVGENAQLHNNGASGDDVIWTSANPDVATVSSTGLVEAKSAGRTVIEAASEDGTYHSESVVTVPSSNPLPDVLYTNDFSGSAAQGWTTYGGAWSMTDGSYKVNKGAGYKSVLTDKSFTDFVLEGDVQITSGDEAGLIFRTNNEAEGANAFNGYYVGINAATQSAVLGQMTKGTWTEIASRKLPIMAGQWYHLKVVADGAHLQVFVNDNPLNLAPYPKFDLLESSHLSTGHIGLRTSNADAMFDNIKISSYKDTVTGPTYTNSIVADIADPFVLHHDGMYYLYGTNTSQDPNAPKGFKVYTSKDLVNWQEQSELALKLGDVWGTSGFWAPEVVEKDGTFYMYYVANERLGVATSASPLGPFVQDVKQPIHPDTPEIDAHVFTDDDGKRYLYFVRFNQGNEIWAAELNDDMKTIKEDTLKFVFRATQEWELSQKQPVASINEGPFMIKHNGTYYLTYSGNHFESPDYGVGYATAPTPMGPWTKYTYNPIMKSNLVVPGAGHHSLVESPDGKELFMVYHTHLKPGVTNPRKLAIDRVHFVPQASGPDAMEVWGPTITPQPVPSSDQTEPAEASAVLSGGGTVAPGQSFDLTFGLSHVSVSQSVYAQDVTVTYDPSLYQFVDAVSLKDGVSVVGKTEQTGKVRLLLASIGAGNAVSGDANVLKLQFTAKNMASSASGSIGVSSTISDANGVETELGAVSAAVKIEIVAKPGDMNHDDRISVGDLAIVAAAYGKSSSDPNWSEYQKADVNGDGKVDLLDLAEVARRMFLE
ncbi:family 43 glycosylhydrolase [Paenibacillus hexagrammi]|uniref:Family 43 glycosylhydrolase n=1 Tax=Paenibacillus hexagrammi TaxID=2908839 RepID=A0ABY3SLI6_9BACL|nr:family 43 glycosylhydrolase [Paenibacillus sp. YPD9-1]UJF34928.1 family 43 glycosylhydrolase [Paenibacillus sp. YPD9-1]